MKLVKGLQGGLFLYIDDMGLDFHIITSTFLQFCPMYIQTRTPIFYETFNTSKFYIFIRSMDKSIPNSVRPRTMEKLGVISLENSS